MRILGEKWSTYWVITETISLKLNTCMCVCVCQGLNHIRLFVTPWTVAHQASLSMKLSREEYWSGLPFPSPGDPPNLGVEPRSPALQADSLFSESPGESKLSTQILFNNIFYEHMEAYISNISILTLKNAHYFVEIFLNFNIFLICRITTQGINQRYSEILGVQQN